MAAGNARPARPVALSPRGSREEVFGAGSGRAPGSLGGFADGLGKGVLWLSLRSGLPPPFLCVCSHLFPIYGGAIVPCSHWGEKRCPPRRGRIFPTPALERVSRNRGRGGEGRGTTTVSFSGFEAVTLGLPVEDRISDLTEVPRPRSPWPLRMGSLSLDGRVSPDPQVLLPGPADVQPFWVLNVSASQLLFDPGKAGERVMICASNLTVPPPPSSLRS